MQNTVQNRLVKESLMIFLFSFEYKIKIYLSTPFYW